VDKENSLYDCAIVGAGIAGLIALRRLKELGYSAIAFDKSRGIGGRIATRRIEGAPLDHGAQFLTRRSPEFAMFVDELLEQQAIFPWFGDKGRERFTGLPSMNAIAKLMAADLEIVRDARVENVQQNNGIWRIASGEKIVKSRSLLVTSPAPQAMTLLEHQASRTFLETLSKIEYEKCIALMILLENKVAISESGFMKSDDPEPIATIADTLKKRGASKPGLVALSGPLFAEKYFNDDPTVATESLLGAFPRRGELKIVATSLQKWRFAKRKQHTLRESFCADDNRMLWHAGDGYVSPNIEGAFLSGLKAAIAISTELKTQTR